MIENYCFDTKTAIGKIPEEYSYTYKFGYTPNKNLTEIHKEDERRPHREAYKTKWKQPNIPLKDFYQDFTPNKEDL